jgi:hypothetical protein
VGHDNFKQRFARTFRGLHAMSLVACHDRCNESEF